jgi:hypothetical protein
MQLPVADVYRDDLGSPALQEAVRETAGGRAYVETTSARDVQAEVAQSSLHLQTASTYVWQDLSGDLDHVRIADGVTRPADGDTVDDNGAALDQYLGALARRRKLSGHKCAVEAIGRST